MFSIGLFWQYLGHKTQKRKWAIIIHKYHLFGTWSPRLVLAEINKVLKFLNEVLFFFLSLIAEKTEGKFLVLVAIYPEVTYSSSKFWQKF